MEIMTREEMFEHSMQQLGESTEDRRLRRSGCAVVVPTTGVTGVIPVYEDRPMTGLEYLNNVGERSVRRLEIRERRRAVEHVANVGLAKKQVDAEIAQIKEDGATRRAEIRASSAERIEGIRSRTATTNNALDKLTSGAALALSAGKSGYSAQYQDSNGFGANLYVETW